MSKNSEMYPDAKGARLDGHQNCNNKACRIHSPVATEIDTTCVNLFYTLNTLRVVNPVVKKKTLRFKTW